jgi:hypothetical protein
MCPFEACADHDTEYALGAAELIGDLVTPIELTKIHHNCTKLHQNHTEIHQKLATEFQYPHMYRHYTPVLGLMHWARTDSLTRGSDC